MPSLSLQALIWQARGLRLRLDLAIPSGEYAVVTAHSSDGAALADVVLGLTPPLDGAIRLDGRDVTGTVAGSRAVTLVPVGGGLLPHLNVESNIAYGGDSAHAADRVRDLGLTGIARRHPHDLSPAQRLRVAVARALCHTTEPVAIVLEDRCGETPYRAAVEAAGSYGATVLVITDRDEAALRPEVLGDAA